MERKHPVMGASAPAILALLSVFLVVSESQIFADSVMGVVDFLASTAGLQVDFYADFINGLALQLQADNLSIARICLIKVSKKLDLKFSFRRCRAEFVQNLIFD